MRNKAKVNEVHLAEMRKKMKRPNICIPITDRTRDRITKRAEAFAGMPADMVEWRIDFFAGYEREIVSLARELQHILAGKKMVATLRTVQEGGEENGSRLDYRALLTELAGSGDVDFVDVEIRRGSEIVTEVVRAARETGTKIIGSYHDFGQTPPQQKIVEMLNQARELGVDAGKFACMPSSEEEQGRRDVDVLLAATEEMKERHPHFPLITMSMGEQGRDSRKYGGLYGSEVSFASAGAVSAPGQIALGELIDIFDNIYSGQRHIFLIGFMGVGKSTISNELRRITGRREVDTDARIVQREGCSIPHIFEEKGELYFRRLETDMIDGLGTLPPAIISCGGGMALRDLNVKKLRALGEVVLLTATPETVYGRVKDSTDRPLLNGNMNVPYIKELMEKRRPFYERAATIVVPTDGKSVAHIAEEIARKCNVKK